MILYATIIDSIIEINKIIYGRYSKYCKANDWQFIRSC